MDPFIFGLIAVLTA